MQDQRYIFSNKKVLLTKSKNNELRWIKDWIKFYKEVHGVNSVLIYDNNSDKYSMEELRIFLDSLDVDVFIIPWNFKFGPTDAPWDSDYCQYGILEHAKERFLRDAAGVIQVDIDELIFSKSKRTVFEALQENPYIRTEGEWIEPVQNDENLGNNFNNLFVRSLKKTETSKKWCIDPRLFSSSMQWRVHDVINIPKVDLSNEFYHFHYKSISTNWRWNRSKNNEFNESEHYLDKDLYEKMFSIFK